MEREEQDLMSEGSMEWGLQHMEDPVGHDTKSSLIVGDRKSIFSRELTGFTLAVVYRLDYMGPEWKQGDSFCYSPSDRWQRPELGC